MIIIVGLGNPGDKFKNTRHNVGFLAIDEFAKINNFEDFKLQKKFDAEISESEINTKKIILVKPQTFMNNSGKSVSKLFSSFKLQASSLIVVHDDIDLPISKIKIVKDRGSAGHKGVESIIKEIDSSDFIRFRIGIKSNQSYGSDCRTNKAKNVVLKNFSKDEKMLVDEAIKKTAEALSYFLENSLEKTMNIYNA
ncbi:MAG: aminoacyl-tRNA hydrolase [Candidatus Staskawiczbacteria bacterium RIFOXYB2_FULL_32_9]|uniref:Peptidyl-tRNA hydrolase n=1 Tax=Candidatus Staskawiczbacteria bacterium RIFOXYD1_FULL_32_13 TaxID=1802234 RepID=A0A1G2JS57_9BACT|nr:MAG: Peptidyl-tRNA hydrolase [Parcubacteria group bacterium GW2011_GWC2_32_10]OGZ78097.1 MAG: aminoacyl-tRNA hydrolase [Candidatus Staskawiczbacteria bacterium RIFOXYA2_FULL_32_7]OGZ79450.1 MAG: aminoacyl-tRNA hydrolase [Candidatus Staskawiczbacteria bacterium RIFOXYB1_FULL_32_11]OGZ83157.1 MAG: aminoacyl-tRNA hydrolase [Candidatus Staskawiczbacteria bacterium RIFOXYB2_FULL_32_9]OGZ87231.1 MAG: aminoacyl-tRNA hydrolase [Candidatus Staskawiczbacteria bacterium RIFOXYC2_FULL_32_10]OGZ89100.1 